MKQNKPPTLVVDSHCISQAQAYLFFIQSHIVTHAAAGLDPETEPEPEPEPEESFEPEPEAGRALL